MTDRRDDDFRVRPSAPTNRGKGQGQSFVSKVLKQAGKASGGKSAVRRPGTGVNGQRAGQRPGSRLGRGHTVARFAGAKLTLMSRRVTIKTLLVNQRNASPQSLAKHLRYIERDGAGRDGEPGRAYGPQTDEADLDAFKERADDDRHHFRFIVSPEDGAELDDLRTYTRHLVNRMEADLGTRLDWVAVDHWNTDNPHTHLIVRGRDDTGKDLIIAGDYIAHGFRHRAAELATEWLGAAQPRKSGDSPARGGRMEVLDRERCKATRRRQCAWPAGGAPGGPLMPRRPSRVATSRRHGEASRAIGLEPRRRIGRVAGKGLADELHDRGYLVIDGVDGKAHYVALNARDELANYPTGAVVEVRGSADVRAADKNIAALASDGLYRADHHLAIEQGRATAGRDPQEVVAAHVRRLEALRRAGIVERVTEGLWKVPDDLAERGRQYDAQRLGGVAVELKSHLPIERQARVIGRHLARPATDRRRPRAGRPGLWRRREGSLAAARRLPRRTGLAQRRGQRVILARNLLGTLRNRELAQAAKDIATETGLEHRPVADGQRVAGIYRRSVQLASGRYAMLDDNKGFSLVPWRPVIEPRLGHVVEGVILNGGVSWNITKQLGISV